MTCISNYVTKKLPLIYCTKNTIVVHKNHFEDIGCKKNPEGHISISKMV